MEQITAPVLFLEGQEPVLSVVESPPLVAAAESPPLVPIAESPPTVAAAESPPLAPIAESPPPVAAAESTPLSPIAESPPLAPVAESPPPVTAAGSTPFAPIDGSPPLAPIAESPPPVAAAESPPFAPIAESPPPVAAAELKTTARVDESVPEASSPKSPDTNEYFPLEITKAESLDHHGVMTESLAAPSNPSPSIVYHESVGYSTDRTKAARLAHMDFESTMYEQNYSLGVIAMSFWSVAILVFGLAFYISKRNYNRVAKSKKDWMLDGTVFVVPKQDRKSCNSISVRLGSA